MQIQIDTREKARAIRKIQEQFKQSGIDTYTSKMYVGDYMSLDNPRLVIDRKQNLTELCSNVCQQHERFRAELIRAQQHGIKIIFLCEHGGGIESLPDVVFWRNPRGEKRIMENGQWRTITTNAMHGDVLFRILSTMERKYDCQFLFCRKSETGARIIELLQRGGI